MCLPSIASLTTTGKPERRSNSIESLLSPMGPMEYDDDSTPCSCDEGNTTSPESTSPPMGDRHTKATMARLKNGQDVCVVIEHGTVNWWASYMQYGFDSNSLFRTIVPTRPTTSVWTQAELDYVQAIQRCIKDGHVRVPYGRCSATFIAERLHTTRERVHRYLKLVQYPPSLDCSTEQALVHLKELKMHFLSTLQDHVVQVMHDVRLDQSWIVAIKY
ncbi:hypothetical protein ACHHYP_07674 [Achlya hypogyna]|uniref:Uncharacterized protein n=1 Tax=Achlya hypogyna TaxID=1202772 RepID=A0A1V9YQS1_ACHHY|nr:hypothetical protein ACHHYP_07674 [Achlya hypogyna]